VLDSSRGGRRWATVVLALAIVATLAVAAVSSSAFAAPAAKTKTTASSPTKIDFSLDFLVDGLHAPLYVAQKLGYLQKANLDVAIHTSTGSSDAIARVASGKAQLGFADAPTTLTAIAKGLPIQVVGMLLLHSAQATETLKSANVTGPKGLIGKNVGITPAGAERDEITALLKLNGVDPSKVHFVSISANNGKANLLAGSVDAVNFFPPIFADVQNKVSFMPWYKYGLDVYGTTIIANTKFLADNPDAVTGLVHSIMEGLHYTLGHPAQAAQVVAAAAKGDPKFFQAELGIYKPYWYDPSNQKQGLGYMTDAGWNKTQSIAVKYLGLSKPVPLTQIYTNKYLGAPVAP
jgi:NitT/TauT family transport system substrate-binding protein